MMTKQPKPQSKGDALAIRWFEKTAEEKTQALRQLFEERKDAEGELEYRFTPDIDGPTVTATEDIIEFIDQIAQESHDSN